MGRCRYYFACRGLLFVFYPCCGCGLNIEERDGRSFWKTCRTAGRVPAGEDDLSNIELCSSSFKGRY